jgi:hypothetical protein
MKTKQQLIERYIEYVYDEFKNNTLFTAEVQQSKIDFSQGYSCAIENLKEVIKQLQKEDITSTVYILREVIKRMENE